MIKKNSIGTFFLKKKIILGLVETVKIGNHEYKAKIDTGADSSSIDKSIIDRLKKENKNIKPLSYKKIKSALGIEKRPVIEIELELLGKKYTEKFTISERSNLRYKILIGKDILKKENFLIDPNK